MNTKSMASRNGPRKFKHDFYQFWVNVLLQLLNIMNMLYMGLQLHIGFDIRFWHYSDLPNLVGFLFI